MAGAMVLGPGQKPVVMPHYPHMLPEERRIWTRFLESKVVEMGRVWYDVHVGKELALPEGTSALQRQISAGITRKRIDVVCSLADVFWVVKIKPRADMHAMGEILTHVRLFCIEYSMTEEVVPVIVCDDVDEDLYYEFEEFGIMVYKSTWAEEASIED